MENKIRVAREGASHELDFEKGLVLGIGPTPERLQIIPVGLDEKTWPRSLPAFCKCWSLCKSKRKPRPFTGPGLYVS